MKKLKNIMLVDDDEITNFINSDLIKDMDISENVTVASDGKEAIDYLTRAYEARKNGNTGDESIIPEFIFLDINMPVMGGFDFLEAYEKLFDSELPTSVIIMLTTSFIKEEVARALTLNHLVKGYIEKPLSAEIIREICVKES